MVKTMFTVVAREVLCSSLLFTVALRISPWVSGPIVLEAAQNQDRTTLSSAPENFQIEFWLEENSTLN